MRDEEEAERARMRADIRTLAAAVTTLALAVERFANNPGAAHGAAQLEIVARDVREHVDSHL
jgi:hypothetical protein